MEHSKVQSVINVPLIYVPSKHADKATEGINSNIPIANDTPEVIDKMLFCINQHKLPLHLSVLSLTDAPIVKQSNHKKLSQKYYRQLSDAYKTAIFIVDEKGQLSLLIDGIRVAPEWSKLQRRIVRAGRKSELLLQSAKLDGTQQVLDATAGFGHDSLILASTGSAVTMLEQHPLIVLLLLIEQKQMATLQNWQKLMSRLQIKWGRAEDYLSQAKLRESKYDVIYLDPMFPDNSYANAKTGKGAKVGKHMQALHGLVSPPSLQDEQRLLTLARQALTKQTIEPVNKEPVNITDGDNSSRLIVKRPISAPHLANHTPNITWRNNVVRFDGYFANDIR